MTIDPRVDIGHVHLKVSDLERAVAFYRDVLGFELQHRYGDQAAFLSAGGYHHHIGLNTWESKGGPPPPRGTTGLYHVAIRYPDRKTLAQAVKAGGDARLPLGAASDHGVSEAIYLPDPDQNGSSSTATGRASSGRRACTRRRSISRRCSPKQCDPLRRAGRARHR